MYDERVLKVEFTSFFGMLSSSMRSLVLRLLRVFALPFSLGDEEWLQLQFFKKDAEGRILMFVNASLGIELLYMLMFRHPSAERAQWHAPFRVEKLPSIPR